MVKYGSRHIAIINPLEGETFVKFDVRKDQRVEESQSMSLNDLLKVAQKEYSALRSEREKHIHTPATGKVIYAPRPIRLNYKDKKTATRLAFFTGGLGLHQFYLDKYFHGVLYLLFVWTLIPIILGIIDGIRLSKMSQEEFDEKYSPESVKAEKKSQTPVPSRKFKVFNASFESILPASSPNLIELKSYMENVRQEQVDLNSQIEQKEHEIEKLKAESFGRQNHAEIEKQKTELYNLYQVYKECYVELQWEENSLQRFEKLKSIFHKLAKSEKVWDIVSSYKVTSSTSGAKNIYDRRALKIDSQSPGFIVSELGCLHLENIDGAGIYIYPGFVMLMNAAGAFTLLDNHELKMKFSTQIFRESTEEPFASDSEVVGYVGKADKNAEPGSPSAQGEYIRLKYGVLTVILNSDNKETYHVSNEKAVERFVESWEGYSRFISR